MIEGAFQNKENHFMWWIPTFVTVLLMGVSILATIPKIYQKKDLFLKRLNGVLTALLILVAVCLFAGFAVLVFNGVEQTIAVVRPYMTFLEI